MTAGGGQPLVAKEEALIGALKELFGTHFGAYVVSCVGKISYKTMDNSQRGHVERQADLSDVAESC